MTHWLVLWEERAIPSAKAHFTFCEVAVVFTSDPLIALTLIYWTIRAVRYRELKKCEPLQISKQKFSRCVDERDRIQSHTLADEHCSVHDKHTLIQCIHIVLSNENYRAFLAKSLSLWAIRLATRPLFQTSPLTKIKFPNLGPRKKELQTDIFCGLKPE